MSQHTATLTLEVTVNYTRHAGLMQTREDPGEPAWLEVDSIELTTDGLTDLEMHQGEQEQDTPDDDYPPYTGE